MNLLIFLNFFLAFQLSFLNEENIWNIENDKIPEMYFIGPDFRFERPANIQLNIEQQSRLANITFALSPGIFVNFFYFKLLDQNILYFETINSKQLLMAKVVNIVNESFALVKPYSKTMHNNIIKWFIDANQEDIQIDRKLVFKVGFKLTQRNTLDSRLIKSLQSYII